MEEKELDEVLSSKFGGYNKKDVKKLFDEQTEKYKLQVDTLTESLNKNQELITRLKKDNELAVKNYNDLIQKGDSRVEEIKTKKNAEIAKITDALNAAEASAEKAETELKAIKDKYTSELESKKKEFEQGFSSQEENFQSALSKKDTTISDLNQKIETLQANLNAKHLTEDEVKEKYESEIRTLTESKTKTEAALLSAEAKIDEYAKQLSDGVVAQYKNKINELTVKVKNLEAAKDAMELKAKQFSAALDSEKNISTSLRNDIAEKGKSLEQLSNALNISQRSKDSLKVELEDLYNKYLSSLLGKN